MFLRINIEADYDVKIVVTYNKEFCGRTYEPNYIATIDLSIQISITDHIDLSKRTTSKSEVSNKNEPTILNKVNLATPQKSTLNLVASNSNDLEETDAVDTNEMSIMNIKITNVTSLPPEVFAGYLML